MGRSGRNNGAKQPGAVRGGSQYLNRFSGIAATYTAGQVVEFEHVITAHHFGHLEMSICDRRINSSTADPAGCLRRWKLERGAPPADCRPNDSRTDCQPVDSRHPERFYLPPRRNLPQTDKFRYRIPAGLQCAECTLQWRWWTANSCVPARDYGCYWDQLSAAGWSTSGFHGYFSGKPCGNSGQPMCNNRGEQFVNCADIRVLASGSPVPTPVGTGCEHEKNCQVSAWCNDSSYETWCRNQGQVGSCPAPHCRWAARDAQLARVFLHKQ